MIRSLLLLFFVVGCASTPMKMATVKEGNWKGRALVKDKDRSRTFIVNLDLNAIHKENLRIDISSTLGQPVSSLVVNDKEVRYFLVDNKTFYTGTPRPESLRPILAIPLDPRLLQSVLFDEAPTGNGWACKNDGNGFVSECHNSNNNLSIVWSNRKGAGKTVDITHPRAEIQLSVRSFTPKVEKMTNLFDLQAPEGFQKTRLR